MGLERWLPHANSFMPAYGMVHRSHKDNSEPNERKERTVAGYIAGALLELGRDIPTMALARTVNLQVALGFYTLATYIEDVGLRPFVQSS